MRGHGGNFGSHNCNHYSTRVEDDTLNFGFQSHHSMANFPICRECAGGRRGFFDNGGNGGVFSPTSHERHGPGALF